MTNWLDSQEFADLCKIYRHAPDPDSAAVAFQALRAYINDQMLGARR